MSTRPEAVRPNKAMATRPGEPTLYVPLSDAEWIEYKRREYMADDNQYLADREEAYQLEVYPFMDEARAALELDDDSTKMDELKAKRKEIKERHPKPNE